MGRLVAFDPGVWSGERWEVGGRRAKFVKVQRLGRRCRLGASSTSGPWPCRVSQHRRIRQCGSIEGREKRMGRRLFDSLAHEGRISCRPLEDGVEALGRLIHRSYTSSSLRELGRTIAKTVRQERRRRERPSELPSFYGACLSSGALKVVHLIAGHHSHSEE